MSASVTSITYNMENTPDVELADMVQEVTAMEIAMNVNMEIATPILVNQGYDALCACIGDRQFTPAELPELVALGTRITGKMSQVDKSMKKTILMCMIRKYIDNCGYNDMDASSAEGVMNALSVSIDTMFNFSHGDFDDIVDVPVHILGVRVLIFLVNHMVVCFKKTDRPQRRL